ncbi:MAG: tRNA adenosine(34) deaminase TadA [Candidatus Omnitrophica bacterium]|nr:tRNA adenosine(34) deaminase TadA [Candidatus Omnitrophota bacterium]
MFSKIDRVYMTEALKEAQKAFDADEVPVGAVIVHKGKVIGRAHNQIKMLKDPTAHAEMIAITQAASYLENERLPGARVYVTIEPCMMCAGALILARVEKLYFGAADPRTGAFGSVVDINKKKLNHKIEVMGGVLEEECGLLMKEFFKKKRRGRLVV